MTPELEIQKEMKAMMKDKIDCMSDTYKYALDKSIENFRETKNDIRNKDMIEIIAKRADMIWHMALQKTEQEMMSARMQNQHSPLPHNVMNQEKSPCQKKAEASAKRISELETEVKALRDSKDPEK